MLFNARLGIAGGTPVILILLFVGSTLAQAPKSNNNLANIGLCNGADHAPAEFEFAVVLRLSARAI